MLRSRLPARAGVGFKPAHFEAICAAPQPVGFFEIHAENYLGAGGPPHAQLGHLRRNYALSIHGVGLSIGSMQPLDDAHLARIRHLCERYEPASFSEHLAWSSHDSVYLNDLLPLPYTDATLDRVAEHIDSVQVALGRQMLLENPATYLQFAESTLAETDFLATLVRRTGCGLLLDINNVVVAATNQGMDPDTYLAGFPLDAVREVHLAGHAATTDEVGEPLLLDSHDRPVSAAVWRLFEAVVARGGAVATLIEWDEDVPAWPILRDEALAAEAILAPARRKAA